MGGCWEFVVAGGLGLEVVAGILLLVAFAVSGGQRG